MAIGHGEGDTKAVDAAEQAIASSLLDVTIDGARGILFNATGGPDMTLFEVNEAAEIIRKTAHPDVNIIFGTVIDDNMVDQIRLTVIATGFDTATAQPRSSVFQSLTSTATSEPKLVKPRISERQPSFRTRTDPIDTGDLDIPTFLRNR